MVQTEDDLVAVEGMGRSDIDSVDIRVLYQGFVIVIMPRSIKPLRKLPGPGAIPGSDGFEPCPVYKGKGGGKFIGYLPGADDTPPIIFHARKIRNSCVFVSLQDGPITSLHFRP